MKKLQHQQTYRDFVIMVWKTKDGTEFSIGNQIYNDIKDAKADIDDWYNETQNC